MQKNKAYKLAIRSILIAIVAIQTMIPFLGNIPLGLVSITIIHITVIVAAIVLGPADGALIGFVWGLITVVRAYVAPTTVMDTVVFTNPVISVLPRILVGYSAGIVYRFFKNKLAKRTLSMSIAAAVGTIVNTGLVLGLMRFMYPHQVAAAYKTSVSLLDKTLMVIIGTNGVPELIAAMIIAPIICTALFKANKSLDA